MGISNGAGLLPLAVIGDAAGEVVDEESGKGVLRELVVGEPSVPGGLEPLPLDTTVPPSGSVTLTCIGVSECTPLVADPEPESCGAVPLERLPAGVESLVSFGSGGVPESASFSFSLLLFFDFLDCCWPMGRA